MGNEQNKELSNVKSDSSSRGRSSIFQMSAEKLDLDKLNTRMFGVLEDIDKEEFEEKKITEWSKTDCLEWLNSIEFEDLLIPLDDKLNSGVDLLSLSIEDEIDPSILEWVNKLEPEEKYRQNVFFSYLHHLKRSCDPKRNEEFTTPNFFSMNFHRMMEKILRIIKNKTTILKYDMLGEHCSVLTNKKMIEKHFFDFRKVLGEVRIRLLLSEPLNFVQMDTKSFLFKGERLNPQMFDPKSVEMGKDVLDRLGEISSGNLRFSILVNDFLLEWTEEGIVIPLRLDNKIKKHIFSLDCLDTSTMSIFNQNEEGEEPDFSDIKGKISEVIEEWNGRKKYSPFPTGEGDGVEQAKSGNAQQFVSEVFEKALGVNLIQMTKKEKGIGVLGRLFQSGANKGSVKIQVKPSKDFENRFKVAEFDGSKDWFRTRNTERFKIRFKTHQELDDFVLHCFGQRKQEESDEDQMSLFPEEFYVLKAIDRMFWTRHVLHSENDQWKPDELCPFGDPRSL